MSLTLDIATFLAGRASLTIGTHVYAGRLPATGAGPFTKLVATGGPGRGHDCVETNTFQVLSVAATPAAAEERARLLYDAVSPASNHRQPLRNVALSSTWRANSIDAIQQPVDIGQGDDGRFAFVFNIAVRVGRIT